MTDMPRRLTSVGEVAKRYDVSERTIRRYIESGRITGYRIGPRLIRVDLNELDAFMQPMGTEQPA